MNGMRKDNLKKAIKYLLILIGIAFACWILFKANTKVTR